MTSTMYEFRITQSDSDSDYDIPVPDIAYSSEKKDRRRAAEVENLVSSQCSSVVPSPKLPVKMTNEASPAREDNSRRLSTSRPLGAIEIQQLQVGELSAALLCTPMADNNNASSLVSSSITSTGQPSGTAATSSTPQAPANFQNQPEVFKIATSGRTFRTSSTSMRDLMKRKALTLPQVVRYDDKTDNFFVDCSAEVFEEVFDFFRTGDLHLPKKCCIEKSLREMRRLNVFPNMLSPCCFARYDRFRAQKEAMKIWYEQLVKDPAEADGCNTNLLGHPVKHKLPLRLRIWNFLENPFSSKFATIYSWVTILMVALSISGFVIETLPEIDVILNDYKFIKSFGELVQLCKRLDNPAVAIDDASNATATSNGSSVIVTTKAPPEPPCPLVYDTKQNRFVATSRDIFNLTAAKPTANDCYLATALWFVDYFAAAFFTFDLLIRFFVCPDKLQFFKSRLNLVDILALVPFYVEIVFAVLAQMAFSHGPSWRRSFQMWEVLEVFRSLRLLRIFRLARWNYGLNVLYYTARAIVGPMSTLLTICVIGILFFGTLMYYVDTRDRFTSIPISIYWAAITMTTVGYGDITPKSGQGCFIATLCASCGILVIGFVLPIVTSKFMFYYQHIKMGRYYKKLARKGSTQSDTSSVMDAVSSVARQHNNKSDVLQLKRLDHSPGTTAEEADPLLNPDSLSREKSSSRKSAVGGEDVSRQAIQEDQTQPSVTGPLVVETNFSRIGDDDILQDELPKTPPNERPPFIPSVSGPDDSDYRIWNGRLDSIH